MSQACVRSADALQARLHRYSKGIAPSPLWASRRAPRRPQGAPARRPGSRLDTSEAHVLYFLLQQAVLPGTQAQHLALHLSWQGPRGVPMVTVFARGGGLDATMHLARVAAWSVHCIEPPRFCAPPRHTPSVPDLIFHPAPLGDSRGDRAATREGAHTMRFSHRLSVTVLSIAFAACTLNLAPALAGFQAPVMTLDIAGTLTASLSPTQPDPNGVSTVGSGGLPGGQIENGVIKIASGWARCSNNTGHGYNGYAGATGFNSGGVSVVYTWIGPNPPEFVTLQHEQVRWCNAQAHADPKTLPIQPTARARGWATDGDPQHAITAERESTQPGTTDVDGTYVYTMADPFTSFLEEVDGYWRAYDAWLIYSSFAAEGSVATVLPYVRGAGNVHEMEKSWRVVE